MSHRYIEKTTLLGTVLIALTSFSVACLPQGGKEERIKKKAAAHADEGEKPTNQKTADATGKQDCEKEDDHDHELRLHGDDEDEAEHADECEKAEGEKKKEEKKEEEHAEGEEDHDHD